MKKFLLSFLVILVAGSILNSCQKESGPQSVTQSEFPYVLGCQFLSPAEYAAIPDAALPEISLKALPTSYFLETPTVGDQGGEGSCVAWGTAYAGRAIDWHYYATGTSTYLRFSPEYVYNQIKVTSSCLSGAYVTSGLNLLKAQGVCSWSSMPYTDKDCSTLPNDAQKAEAYNYRISSYGKASLVVATLKGYIATSKPVIVAGPVNMAFEYLKPGQVLGKFSGKSLGGHCYCLVGYDDAKNAFKFQNSWGSSWASSGFGWISYTYIKSWWQEAYVITTANP